MTSSASAKSNRNRNVVAWLVLLSVMLAAPLALFGDKKKKKDDEEAQDPNEKPDEIKFDEKGKKGKQGEVEVAQQTAEMWMRNIQTTPAQLLRRKFAIEAQEPNK